MTTGPAIEPFRALRYDEARVGDPGAVWAPPYDVISTEQAEALRRRHPRNIVRITLPQPGEPDRYEAAGALLRSWIEEGTLVREDRPCGYVHRQWFRDPGGHERVRTGLWALVRMVELDAGIVLPHERTLSGPKADRLSLMRATHAQLSPIFFVASDTDGRMLRSLEDPDGTSADRVQRTEFPEGERHELRGLAADRIAEISEGLLGETLLIADGHHRYETALAYRDERNGEGGSAYVLGYLVSERDPGLAVHPTHRVVTAESDLPWSAVLDDPGDDLRVERLSERSLEDPEGSVARLEGGPSFIVILPGHEGGWRVELTRAGADRAGLDEAAARLSSVAFHGAFLPRAAPGGAVPGSVASQWEERLSYTRDAAEAVRRVRHGSAAAAVLLSGARIGQIRDATRGGVRLPPKTTFFAPKVPTGPAIHLMDPA